MSVYHYKMAPAAYLQFYIKELIKNCQVYQVNFDEDSTLSYPSQKVLLPLSKLVFGFANGCAKDIDTSYQNLAKAGIPPGVFMYCV
jgi:uncharacterized spore protein YtfJ